MASILNISAENFLSLQKVTLDLCPLNVLVGPNGAGKTNILKILEFLGDVARLDLIPAIDQIGSFDDLLFRGRGSKSKQVTIKFKGIISENASNKAPDEYKLTFWERPYKFTPTETRRLVVRSEEIVIKRMPGRGRRITLQGSSVKVEPFGTSSKKESRLTVQRSATGLATLRRLGNDYEANGVESLAQIFEQLRLFEIDVDKVRRPSSLISDSALRPDASNLASYLFYLSRDFPNSFDTICDDIRYVLPSFLEFKFVHIGGADDGIRLDLVERHLNGSTPLARASFGTIRAIALFAMLNDPHPPKLTCLEEIDHGLHPHALDRLIDRLREASAKTQIILATHSPALVNRLQAHELIIVECDDETGATRAFRPSSDLVSSLKSETDYELGELWFSGALGGGL